MHITRAHATSGRLALFLAVLLAALLWAGLQPAAKAATTKTYTLATSASPLAGGTLARSPAGTSYAAGSKVAVTATAAAGYVFVNWGGACTGTSTCNVTLTANATVTATFKLRTYTLSTATYPISGGTAARNPAGPSYAAGTKVAVTATPAAGYVFSNWTGACTGTAACSVTMTADTTVYANFSPKTVNLSVQASPAAGGTVTRSPAGPAYPFGSKVSVTAAPAAGYAFSSWSGACVGNSACSVTVNADSTVTANFTVLSIHALVASAALQQVAATPLASPRSLASLAPLFAELDPAGSNAALRSQSKSWYTDLEDGGTGTQDGQRIRSAIQRYANWKTSTAANRPTFAVVQGQMEADVGPVYDATRRSALAARIVAVWEAQQLAFNQRVVGAVAPTVPGTDQATLDFMGMRTQCFEWVATVGLRAGARSVSYATAAVARVADHRAGMAMFWYTAKGGGAHAAIVTSIELDAQGNPAYYRIAESNWASGWQNPGGAVPWQRSITTRRIPAVANPVASPTLTSAAGRVVSFVAR